MIGNDIVDLADEDSRVTGHHRRFDSRVFADEERHLLRCSADAERLRWSLWAAKESAYKLLRREDAALVFAPPRFVVRPAAAGDAATVEVSATRVHVRLETTADFVHAIASRHEWQREEVCRAVADLTDLHRRRGATAAQLRRAPSAGEAVRQLVLASLGPRLGVPEAELSVGRARRAPLLLRLGQRLPGTLSLSHHGRFVAFAWTAAGA